MRHDKVLVVGTTTDYVERIESEHPGRCVFLTDVRARAAAHETPPEPGVEILGNLEQPADAEARLAKHLTDNDLRLNGLTCFDCESLPLAAWLGKRLGLPYPSERAVALARHKHLAVSRWRAAGVPTPRSAMIRSEAEAVRFFRSVGGPLVMKPLCGSGSELVFACADEDGCRSAFRQLRTRLAAHPDARMYAPLRYAGKTVDPRRVFAAEKFIDGVELSCDFVVAAGKARIIRVCRKFVFPGEPLGTVNAYLMPADLPFKVSLDALETQLHKAAAALGLEEAICMADLIACRNEVVMLELAPRLAGDCLPALIRASSGLDVLGFALDFAAGASPPLATDPRPRRLVALRLLAEASGTVSRLDSAALRADPRVVSVQMLRAVGDPVLMPPSSSDHRLLGYAIFRPNPSDSVYGQCRQLAGRLGVAIESQAVPENRDAELRPALRTG